MPVEFQNLDWLDEHIKHGKATTNVELCIPSNSSLTPYSWTTQPFNMIFSRKIFPIIK